MIFGRIWRPGDRPFPALGYTSQICDIVQSDVVVIMGKCIIILEQVASGALYSPSQSHFLMTNFFLVTAVGTLTLDIVTLNI